MIHRKKLWKYAALLAALGVLLMTRSLGEPDDLHQISGVSLDYGVHKRFLFGFEVADTAGADNNKSVSSHLVEVEADDLSEALEAADLMSSRALRLDSASLLVLSAEVTADLNDVAAMFLKQWSGQINVLPAVATEGRAADILRAEHADNLRAAAAGEQIKAAARTGKLDAPTAPEAFSRYLDGGEIALPMLVSHKDGYAIRGTYQCN